MQPVQRRSCKSAVGETTQVDAPDPSGFPEQSGSSVLRVGRQSLQHLQSIPERVIDVDTIETVERLVVVNLEPGSACTTRHPADVVNNERNVCFARRPEVLLDTEMDSDAITLEPCPTPYCQVRRLGNLAQAEEIGVEAPSLDLGTRRHRELNVVDRS